MLMKLITSFISNHFILIRDVGTVGAQQDYTPWMGRQYITGHHTLIYSESFRKLDLLRQGANCRRLRGSDPALIRKVRIKVNNFMSKKTKNISSALKESYT